MTVKTKKSITRLSAVFVGFIIGNIDKFINYCRIDESIVVIILQTTIYWVIIPLTISLLFGFFSQKKQNIRYVFKSRLINYILVIIMLIIIAIGIAIDAGYKIKSLECEKFNQTIENQQNCIRTLKNNRLHFNSIFSDE